MAKRIILKDDAACLYKRCREVERFDEKTAELLEDMADTLHDADGVGLAAPQVGILKRIFVIDMGEGVMEFINPTIMKTSGEQGDMEACLSFPGRKGYVIRPNFVRVRAYNRHGELMEYEGEGLFARAVMHENDHLNGEVYLRLITETPKDYREEE